MIDHGCCVLCGCMIPDDPTMLAWTTWMTQFVAVYAVSTEAGATAYLSGPGRKSHDVEDFVQPLSAAGISSGPDTFGDGLSHDGLIPIRLLQAAWNIEPGHDDQTAAWGFPVHSACWETLSRFCPMEEQSWLQAFFDLCRGLPMSDPEGPLGLCQLRWGHLYQGAALAADSGITPEEDVPIEGNFDLFAKAESPLSIQRLAFVFKRAVNSPKRTTNSPELAGPGTDVLANLPAELRGGFLELLPSADVFSLRQASRAFACIPLRVGASAVLVRVHAGTFDRFWKTRFLRGRELEHVFEAAPYFSSHAHNDHWAELYRSVRAILRISGGMKTRKRVWAVSRELRDVLEQVQGKSCSGRPVKSCYEQDAPPDDDADRWVTASRSLFNDEEFWTSGCKVLRERTLAIPPSGIAAVFASVIELFSQRRYISGLRVVDVEGNSHSIGYRQPENELLLHSEGGAPFRINGFHLAQCQRGVRGIALLLDAGAVSEWGGDHRDIPKRRLILNSVSESSTPIDSWKCGFDGVKLLTVAVSPRAHQDQPELSGQLDLRDTAIWHPKIPDPNLSFLGTSGFLYGPNLDAGPVFCFSIFADPGGSKADNLTRITVRARPMYNDYVHDEGEDEAPSHFDAIATTGQRPIDEEVGCLGSRQIYDHVDQFTFDIDGPGGERITRMDTFHGLEDKLLGFRIHTNRGRTADFPSDLVAKHGQRPSYVTPGHETWPGFEPRSVRADGQTVVGFWGIMLGKARGFYDVGLVATSQPGFDRSCQEEDWSEKLPIRGI